MCEASHCAIAMVLKADLFTAILRPAFRRSQRRNDILSRKNLALHIIFIFSCPQLTALSHTAKAPWGRALWSTLRRSLYGQRMTKNPSAVDLCGLWVSIEGRFFRRPISRRAWHGMEHRMATPKMKNRITSLLPGFDTRAASTKRQVALLHNPKLGTAWQMVIGDICWQVQILMLPCPRPQEWNQPAHYRREFLVSIGICFLSHDMGLLPKPS